MRWPLRVLRSGLNLHDIQRWHCKADYTFFWKLEDRLRI
jgi:hypothetical protein